MLIRLCEFRGWTLTSQPLFAGVSFLYLLERDGDHVGPYRARTLADVAVRLFTDAMARGDSTTREEAPVDRSPGDDGRAARVPQREGLR